LHLEDRRIAVADVDHPGILARALDHPRRLGRELLQVNARRFVRAMLRPHDREYAELDEVRLAAERLQDAAVFLVRKAVLGHDFGSDGGSFEDVHARLPNGAARSSLAVVAQELLA